MTYTRWGEFVKKQGIGGVNIFDYYGIAVSPGVGGSVSEQEVEAVAKEMLRDLVAVDAITLPPGVGVDDFSLEVRNADHPLLAIFLTYKIPCLVLRNDKTNVEEVCFPVSDHDLSHSAKVGGGAVINMAFNICCAMRSIYAPEGIRRRAEVAFVQDYQKEQDPGKKERLRLLGAGWEERPGGWRRDDVTGPDRTLEDASAVQEKRGWPGMLSA